MNADVFIVSQISVKENIIYSITKTTNIPAVFSKYVGELRVQRGSYPRVLIFFCQTISGCANIYEFFRQKLEHEFTHPTGAPDISYFHFVDMYTSVTTLGVKKQIEKHMEKGTVA